MTVVRVNLPVVGGTTAQTGVTTATVQVPVLKAATGAATTRAQPVPVTTSQPLATATASQNAPQVGIATVQPIPSVADSTVTILGEDSPLPELGSNLGSTLGSLSSEGLDMGSTLGMQRPTVVSVVSTESEPGYEALQSRPNNSTSMTTFTPIDPPSQVCSPSACHNQDLNKTCFKRLACRLLANFAYSGE